MSDDGKICVEFPKPKTLKIPLPFGVELQSITDISQGPPTDCALAHSLMLQISPMLAGMTCMLRVLKVISDLKDFVTAVPDPVKLGQAVPKLLDDIDKLVGCFGLLDPCALARTIAGILQMIIAYLNCLIEAFESLWNFQIGIDLNAAEGNPVLLANLSCAIDNAQSSMTSLGEALAGIQPILDMVNMLLEIVGLPAMALPPLSASTPSPAQLAGGQDPMAPVKTLRDALQQAIDALPCK